MILNRHSLSGLLVSESQIPRLVERIDSFAVLSAQVWEQITFGSASLSLPSARSDNAFSNTLCLGASLIS